MKRTILMCTRRRPVLLGGLLVLGFAACRGDAPTAPRDLAAPDTTQLGIASRDVAGLLDALMDLRTRILPALGDGQETQTLADALADLGRTLAPTPAATFEEALARANAAATQLGADTTIRADLDVVLLTLEQIEATARGSIERVPITPSDSSVARRES